MKEYISVLKNTVLFRGVEEEELSAMLDCLQAKAHRFEKGEYVIRQGSRVEALNIVAEGTLHIQREDYWGNRSIINVLEAGDLLGESYLSQDNAGILHDVVANKNTVVISFDVKKILTTCSAACRFHQMVIENLFFAISEKNRALVQKLGHMSQRTTREKLISYLSEEANKQKNSSFCIPFNRQQLADFLSVDRSAMSKELCNMRDEGLLRFQKNKFTLLEK